MAKVAASRADIPNRAVVNSTGSKSPRWGNAALAAPSLAGSAKALGGHREEHTGSPGEFRKSKVARGVLGCTLPQR